MSNSKTTRTTTGKGGGKAKRRRGPDAKPRKRREDGATNHPTPPPNPREGVTDPLPKGAVSAIKGLRYRVPKDTPEILGDLADEAFDSVVSVMRDKGNPMTSFSRLNAARLVREEICGPIKQVVQHEGLEALGVRLHDARQREIDRVKAEAAHTVKGEKASGKRGR